MCVFADGLIYSEVGTTESGQNEKGIPPDKAGDIPFESDKSCSETRQVEELTVGQVQREVAEAGLHIGRQVNRLAGKLTH